ncbi:hypothetical protein C8F04DRAFT_1397393 [Mycena alexandri]|uniref:Uncharacterized protein n=1 Tax=Mycena alexandri TaxID=1745969 RepID=A0AAD6X0G7_9AGAR|nr:hypothetical protein C8F04DRAFT_1397393 [Mycena alexandri]
MSIRIYGVTSDLSAPTQKLPPLPSGAAIYHRKPRFQMHVVNSHLVHGNTGTGQQNTHPQPQQQQTLTVPRAGPAVHNSGTTPVLHTAHILSAHASLEQKNRAVQDIKEQRNKEALESERTRLIECLSPVNEDRNQADLLETALERERAALRAKIHALSEAEYKVAKADVDGLRADLGQPPLPSLQETLDSKGARWTLRPRSFGSGHIPGAYWAYYGLHSSFAVIRTLVSFCLWNAEGRREILRQDTGNNLPCPRKTSASCDCPCDAVRGFFTRSPSLVQAKTPREVSGYRLDERAIDGRYGGGGITFQCHHHPTTGAGEGRAASQPGIAIRRRTVCGHAREVRVRFVMSFI